MLSSMTWWTWLIVGVGLLLAIEGLARTEIASFLQLTDVTRSGVLATAQSFTEVVSSAPARRTLAGTTIDLDAVASGDPVTIYLVIQVGR